MKNNMMNVATSLIQNLPAMKNFKKNDVSDAVSIREGKFVVSSCSRWKHRGIQGKICSTRPLMERRNKLRRDILQPFEVKTHDMQTHVCKLKKTLYELRRHPVG